MVRARTRREFARPAEVGPIDLGRLVDRALAVPAARALAKGLAFEVDEAPELPRVVLGDGERLARALAGLLARVVAGASGGAITLAVRPWEGGVAFAVHARGARPLRLAGCRYLVAAMGGTIAIGRAPGARSVELRVPLAVGVPARAAPSGTVVLRGPPMRRLEDALRARGVDVVTLADGEGVPDEAALVVVDALLPGGPMPGGRSARGVRLERPLRARHVVAALFAVRDATEASPVAGRLVGLTILAAEDNRANRLVLQGLLDGSGARLVCVEDGQRAVEAVRAAAPGGVDLVLTDIRMPGMDGYETCRALHALDPELPVIGLTADAMPEQVAACLTAGMVAHAATPLEPDALVALIARHARRGVAAAGSGWEGEGTAVAETRADGWVIDWWALEARFGGNRPLVDRLAVALLQTHGTTPGALRGAAVAGDYPALAFLAHGARGVAGNLRLGAVHALAGDTEHAAAAERPEAIASARALADTLDQILEQARDRVGATTLRDP